MNDVKYMSELAVGERGAVVRLLCGRDMRRRLLDLGFAEGVGVECIGKSPLGDPSAYLVRGKTVAIRGADARSVTVACATD